MSHLRLPIVGAGLADALVFGHIAGAVTALIIIGIFELCVIADDRSRRRRAVEDALAQSSADAADDERRKRRGALLGALGDRPKP